MQNTRRGARVQHGEANSNVEVEMDVEEIETDDEEIHQIIEGDRTGVEVATGSGERKGRESDTTSSRSRKWKAGREAKTWKAAYNS